MDAAGDAGDAGVVTPGKSAVARWRSGEIGFPALIGLLLALGVVGLAAASIDGWGSVVVIAIVMLAFLGLITSWAVSG